MYILGHILTPWLQGAGNLWKFLVRGTGKFFVHRGIAGLLGGAEDFDELCRSVMKKFSKIE